MTSFCFQMHVTNKGRAVRCVLLHNGSPTSLKMNSFSYTRTCTAIKLTTNRDSTVVVNSKFTFTFIDRSMIQSHLEPNY
jgi:hypothetical protein